MVQAASSAGDDFKMALLTRANVPPAAVYTEVMVLDDTVAGVPAMTMPQVRQVGLLGETPLCLGESRRS